MLKQSSSLTLPHSSSLPPSPSPNSSSLSVFLNEGQTPHQTLFLLFLPPLFYFCTQHHVSAIHHHFISHSHCCDLWPFSKTAQTHFCSNLIFFLSPMVVVFCVCELLFTDNKVCSNQSRKSGGQKSWKWRNQSDKSAKTFYMKIMRYNCKFSYFWSLNIICQSY